MCLNQKRVRIGREQSGQGKDMSGRFQDPATSILSFLQMLQKASVKVVGGLQVLLEKPFSIARHVVHGVELITQKARAHQADAFLRQKGANGMKLTKHRRAP